MFKSTKEFNGALCNLLKAIQEQPNTLQELQDLTALDDSDFEEILRHVIDSRYVSGISLLSGIGGIGGHVFDNPKVTLEGLTFIENWDKA